MRDVSMCLISGVDQSAPRHPRSTRARHETPFRCIRDVCMGDSADARDAFAHLDRFDARHELILGIIHARNVRTADSHRGRAMNALRFGFPLNGAPYLVSLFDFLVRDAEQCKPRGGFLQHEHGVGCTTENFFVFEATLPAAESDGHGEDDVHGGDRP